jgi:hypothetical protein
LGEEQAIGSDDGKSSPVPKAANPAGSLEPITRALETYSSVGTVVGNGDGGRCSEGRKTESMEEITLGASCGLLDDALSAGIELRPNDLALA